MDFGHFVAGPPSLKVAKGHSGHVFDRVMDTTSAHNVPITLELSRLHLAMGHIKRWNGRYLGLNAVMDKASPQLCILHEGGSVLYEAILVHEIWKISIHGTKLVQTTTPQLAQDIH